ncbi:hypothetical protein EVAR_51960_1 [Eumeta japonica]|uniref:Mos1 transposase HTH domain-containing protein n=1 Tax=Eumeta variegata TaxID=151549 RepID=A0A4C1Y5H9_EUMVA|nr:hypothetical protein EVAR_51960_1 [Eumeta japonica]
MDTSFRKIRLSCLATKTRKLEQCTNKSALPVTTTATRIHAGAAARGTRCFAPNLYCRRKKLIYFRDVGALRTLPFARNRVRRVADDSKMQLRDAAVEFNKLHLAVHDEVPSLASVDNWFNEFKRGRTNLTDDLRERRPSTAPPETTSVLCGS